VFRCQGGIAAAAWKFYTDVGIVTGGNYNSQKVRSNFWTFLVSSLSLFSVTILFRGNPQWGCTGK